MVVGNHTLFDRTKLAIEEPDGDAVIINEPVQDDKEIGAVAALIVSGGRCPDAREVVMLDKKSATKVADALYRLAYADGPEARKWRTLVEAK